MAALHPMQRVVALQCVAFPVPTRTLASTTQHPVAVSIDTSNYIVDAMA